MLKFRRACTSGVLKKLTLNNFDQDTDEIGTGLTHSLSLFSCSDKIPQPRLLINNRHFSQFWIKLPANLVCAEGLPYLLVSGSTLMTELPPEGLPSDSIPKWALTLGLGLHIGVWGGGTDILSIASRCTEFIRDSLRVLLSSQSRRFLNRPTRWVNPKHLSSLLAQYVLSLPCILTRRSCKLAHTL